MADAIRYLFGLLADEVLEFLPEDGCGDHLVVLLNAYVERKVERACAERLNEKFIGPTHYVILFFVVDLL